LNRHSFLQSPRRKNLFLSSYSTNINYLRHPLVIAWWSAAFPGFGHLILGKFMNGFTLAIWEVVINYNAKINEAMIYSFTGRFEMAKEALDTRWMLLYISVYIYAIWDSYRLTVDLNKAAVLGEREQYGENINFRLGPFSLNYLDKHPPWLVLVWSLLMPGLGHLYLNRLSTGLYLLIASIVYIYYSHLLEGLHLTLLGHIREGAAVLDPEWVLFYPSVFCFSFYDAYVLTVESNKAFKTEQARYLKRTYQSSLLRLGNAGNNG